MKESKSDPNVYETGDPGGSFYSRMEISPDGLVFVKNVGVLDVEHARENCRNLKEISEKMGQRLLVCLDISEYKGSQPAARIIMKDNTLGSDSPMQAFANYGGSFAVRTLFNLFAKVSGIPVRQFKTKEEAVEWLHSYSE